MKKIVIFVLSVAALLVSATVYSQNQPVSFKNPELLEFLKTHNGQMLHASYLSFAHPITGETMIFKAPIPADMLELQEILENS